MRDKIWLRRDFLRMVAAAPVAMGATLPFAVSLSCGKGEPPADEVELALQTLILAIGPWGEDRRAQAVDFAGRFLAVKSASGTFFEQGEIAKELAGGTPFREQPMALESLNLKAYSDAEREFLVSLVTKVYGFFEVHYFHVAGMPDVGVCSNREWYTQPPSEW